MKNRKLVVGLLVMLAVVMSTLTFAYWASLDLDDSVASTSVKIGEGRTATVTASLNSSGQGVLVPAGMAENSVGYGTGGATEPVEELVFTFTVDLEDNVYIGDAADIEVLIDNVSSTTAGSLLNFFVTDDNSDYGSESLTLSSSITEGTTLTIYVKVTLDEPADQTEYNAVINADVTFDITFTVEDLAQA